MIKRHENGEIREVTVKASNDNVVVERVLTKAILESWRWDMIMGLLNEKPKLVQPLILELIRQEMND